MNTQQFTKDGKLVSHKLMVSISREVIEPLKWVALILLLTCLPKSLSENKDIRVFSETLVIQVNKKSPAYAAHFDALNKLEDNYPGVKEEVELLAGTDSAFDILIGMVEEKSPSQKLHKNNETTYPRVIEIADHIIDQPMPSIYSLQGDLLPLGERKQKLLQHFTDINIDLKGDSWQEKAAELEKAEESVTKSGSKIIYTKNNVPIIITRPVVSRRNKKNVVKTDRSTDAEIIAKHDSEPKKGKDEVEEPGVSLMALEPAPVVPRAITGNLRLMGGLAYTGENELSIFWEDNGEVIGEGKIWLDQGKYEISVDRLEGYIVAELRDELGALLALSELDLYDLSEAPYSPTRIEGIGINLSPVVVGIKAKLISARSFGEHVIYAPGQRLFIDELGREVLSYEKGSYRDTNIINGSTLFVRTSGKGFWPTIYTVVAGAAAKVLAYPDKMVEALLNLTRGRKLHDDGIIWGQVMIGGKGVAGATVDLAGDVEAAPIYFEKFSELIDLPSLKLEKTSANGLFSFTGLPPGAYAVRATIDGKLYPAQLIAAEERAISFVNLSYDGYRSVNLKIHDPINKTNSLSGRVNVYGADLEISVDGLTSNRIRVPKANHPFMLEVEAGEAYAQSRVFVDNSVRVLSLPVIPQNWIDNIAAQANIAEHLKKNVVVGLVNGDGFDVLMSDKNENLRIIYFNSAGDLLDDSVGVDGGGFVAFNANEFVQTFAVVPTSKNDVATRIFYPEAKFINVFEINL